MYTAVKPSESATCQDVCMNVCASQELLDQPVLPSTKCEVSASFAIQLCTESGTGGVSHVHVFALRFQTFSKKIFSIYSNVTANVRGNIHSFSICL